MHAKIVNNLTCDEEFSELSKINICRLKQFKAVSCCSCSKKEQLINQKIFNDHL